MKKIYCGIIAVFMMVLINPQQVKAITKVDQTTMKTTSASISWQKQADEASFRIYIWMPSAKWEGNKLITTYTNKCLGDTSATTYTFRNLKAGQTYDYILWSLDQDGDPLREIQGTVKTSPGPIEKMELKFKWSSYYELGSKNTMTYNLYVDIPAQNSADGYDIYLYNSKGKLVKKVKAKADESSVRRYAFKNLKDNCYLVKARAYNSFEGKKYYGKWTSKDYTFRQPASAAMFSGNMLYIKWEKTEGVSGYDVYMSASKNGVYKKVKSAGKNTTMISLKKFNGKAFKKDKTYYYYIEAKRNVGKKVFTSALSRKFKVVIR